VLILFYTPPLRQLWVIFTHRTLFKKKLLFTPEWLIFGLFMQKPQNNTQIGERNVENFNGGRQ